MIQQFDAQERAFLFQEAPMSLKHGIISKLDKTLWEAHQYILSTESQNINSFHEWKEIPKGKTRIFKGENYIGLPWIAIDNIAHYEKEKSLAYRILVVWGRGAYLNFLAEKSVKATSGISKDLEQSLKPVSVLTMADSWIQHCTEFNSATCEKLTDAISLRSTFGYTRLIEHIPFNEWGDFNEKCREAFRNHLLWMRLILQNNQYG